MKQFVLFVLAGMLGVTSCRNEQLPGPKGDTGPQGPKGDTGAQGPKGEPGTANVWSYVYKDQRFGVCCAPEYNALTKLYTTNGFKELKPEEYADTAEAGAVLVYLRDELNAWTLNSIQFNVLGENPGSSGSRIETTAQTLSDKVRLRAILTGPTNSNQILLNYKVDVKIILIAATNPVLNALRTGQVNPTDYQSVERSLALKPV